jgi:magnesium-transporting ATPase (P-type)
VHYNAEFIFGKPSLFEDQPELKEAVTIFKEMLMEVDSVICSRTIPKHKAKLVALVKSYKKVVLAVGDGANDVNMLTVDLCSRRRPTSA